MDRLFNEEIKDFVSGNNAALVKALEDAKDPENAFISSARDDVRETVTPALDDSKSWDLNLYVDGERISSARYKNRVDAIEALYHETAPLFGGAETWSVAGAEPELFDTTDLQFGDLAKRDYEQTELFEYDDETIKLVYGSKEAFDTANAALQLSLFDGQDDGNGDLYSQYSDYGSDQGKNTGGGDVPGRRRRAHSVLLGDAGTPINRAYKENRKRQRRIEFTGQSVTSPQRLAELFQVYRNPQVETFHVVYLNGYGEILAHNAISSGVAGTTASVNKANYWREKYLINQRIERLGAEKVYILHNHPSGNPKPSAEDVVVTNQYLQMIGDKFAGHVIIDHDTASFITPQEAKGKYITALAKPIATAVVPRAIRPSEDSYDIQTEGQIRFQTTEQMEQYAIDTLSDDRESALIITDYLLRVIEWRPWKNPDMKAIYQAVKESGGSHGFVITKNTDFFEKVNSSANDSIYNKNGQYLVLADSILVDGNKIDHRPYYMVMYDKDNPISHYKYITKKAAGKVTLGKFVMESDLAQEAGEFDSYQEFKNAYVSEGEDDSELKKAWAEKQNKKSSAELDQDFISMLQADRQKLRDFLEANGADLFNRKMPRKNMSVVDATSYRLATGGVVSDATIDRAMMLIEKHPVKWRKRFADLSGELWSEGKPQDFDIAPPRRKSLATLQAKHKEAISKLPDGAEVIGSAEELAVKTEELRRELENKKRALKELQDRFSYGEKRIVDMVRQQKDIEKRIWAERARAKLSSEYKEIIKELETQAKELKAAIAERTMALSPQSGMKGAAYAIAKKEVKEATDALKQQYAIEKAKRTEQNLLRGATRTKLTSGNALTGFNPRAPAGRDRYNFHFTIIKIVTQARSRSCVISKSLPKFFPSLSFQRSIYKRVNKNAKGLDYSVSSNFARQK